MGASWSETGKGASGWFRFGVEPIAFSLGAFVLMSAETGDFVIQSQWVS